MKVKRNTLLLLACLLWSAAGYHILRIGLAAYPACRTMLNYLLPVLVFAVFQRFIPAGNGGNSHVRMDI